MSSLTKYQCDQLINEADFYNLPNLLVNDAPAQDDLYDDDDETCDTHVDDTAQAMKNLQQSVKSIDKSIEKIANASFFRY